MLYILPTLAVLMLLGWVKPMLDRFFNNLEFYNNCSVMLLAYCLLCETDFVPGPSTRFYIGLVMVILTFQNLFVNLYMIALAPLLEAMRLWRTCWLRRRHKQRITQY